MMRALSLWEPWASAMANGFKAIETRSWPTGYRGDLLICAAKTKVAADILKTLPQAVAGMAVHPGCALCVVELFDVVGTLHRPGGLELLIGDYSAGRFAWLTRNLRRLPAPLQWR